MRKLLLFFLIFSFASFLFLYPNPYTLTPTYAQSTEELAKQVQDKEAEIQKLEAKLANTKNQEKTLKSQLDLIDGQTKVTTLKIEETNLKIDKLKREISDLETRIDRIGVTLDSLSEILLNRIVQTYKYNNTVSTIDLLFSSHGFTDLIERLKYIQVAQAYDKKKLYELQAAKLAYNDQKQDKQTRQAEAEKLNKDLEVYKKKLDDQKKAKQELLDQTKGDEATYENLLSQARAQLAGFANFADSKGGASLLSGQTVCNDWGCYYNQRDNQWGNILINNRDDCSGPCSTARVGCLITSLSMIASHLGHKDILPSDIALSNSDNFSVGTASLKKGTISVKGFNITRTTVAGSLDPNLVQNDPVIVGVRSGPFGTHFVVVKSYSNGNYVMNDPFVEGGRDKNFTDYYSLGSVFEVDKVSI